MADLGVLIVSASRDFVQHARFALGPSVRVETVPAARQVIPAMSEFADLLIVHVSDIDAEGRDAAFERLGALGLPMTVAADVPDLGEMLDLSRHDIRAYFNSRMTDVHYRQMARMVGEGVTWFSPPMMSDALALARESFGQGKDSREAALSPLTNRERQIAVDVASGLSNREIAEERSITERTVKAHLTRIFRKLGTRNRHALAMKLRGS